jgi:drug/metabolite transporter (DMT)-like permease
MLGMVLIGSFFVVNKQIIREVPIFFASEMRLLIGSIVLYAIGIWRRDISLRITWVDIKTIAFQVFFGVFLFSIFSLSGLKRTSAINGGIIMGLTTVVILLLGLFVKRERVTSRT